MTTTETTTETTDELTARIRAALATRAAARPYDPETNPLAHLSVTDLVHGRGIEKQADQYPAINKGDKLDSARIEGLANGRADMSAKRMATARARRARQAQIDAIEVAPARPNAERLADAWLIVAQLEPIIASVARSKRQYASRFLGDITGDLASQAAESIVLILAKDDRHDLEVLLAAAVELTDETRRTGRSVPGQQVERSADERAQRKAIGKGRKWLMTVVNRRVQLTLVDMFRERGNLRWENLDVLDTVMAQVSGTGEDPLMARFKVDKAPSFMGTRFASPGGIDGNLLATAIMAGITEHGLDAIAEVLLDEAHVRTDGSFRWAEFAELVFRATPGGAGGDMWLAVQRATEALADPRKAQAAAARTHVRNLFEWMPGFIASVVDAFDQYEVSCTWVDGSGPHSRLRSTFESYLPASDGVRRPLVPSLRFADADEATRTIAQHLSILFTGQDFLDSIDNA